MFTANHQDHIWLFGYGSIIWKQGFAYEEKRPAFIRGYERRFWQESIDHRGVPEAPGRVVTLWPSATSLCWGIAFRINGDVWTTVVKSLDLREKGGYIKMEVDLYFDHNTPAVSALTYFAGPDNPHFTGPEDPTRIIQYIASSSGPSGTNRDYLLNLANGLRSWSLYDEHVFYLEHLLLEKESTGT